MAGWDEETLLLATFVVEDTPDRESGHKKQPRLRISETPPSSSRVKGIAWRQSGAPSPGVAINIDDNKEKKQNNLSAKCKVTKNCIRKENEETSCSCSS